MFYSFFSVQGGTSTFFSIDSVERFVPKSLVMPVITASPFFLTIQFFYFVFRFLLLF